jgi:hypothetical protein
MLLNGRAIAANSNSYPFINGFNFAVTGDTTFTLTPGSARDYGSDLVISYPSNQSNGLPNLTLDVNKVGLLGLFPWSYTQLNIPAVMQPYGVYVISSTNGSLPVSAIVSTSISVYDSLGEENLILPEGYDAFRRVGTIMLQDAPPILRPVVQAGFGTIRNYMFAQRIRVDFYTPMVNFPINLSVGTTPLDYRYVRSVTFTRSLTGAAITDYCTTTPSNKGTNSTRFPNVLTFPALTPGNKISDTVSLPVSLIDNEMFIYVTVVGGGGTSLEHQLMGFTEDYSVF